MKIFRAQVGWKDSFQQIIDIWEENGLCDVEESKDRYSWVEHEKKVLLHEHDRCENLPEFDVGFFANEVPREEKCFPWIYWPRFPKKLEKHIQENGIMDYSQRGVESIFIGAAENPVQHSNRTKFDWDLCVEEFDFNVQLFQPNPHKYTNEEYLQKISNAKFGLTLEGYGPKCQRDIEYMALGVVPIFTWKSFNDYAHPLKEGVHYLYAPNPREVKDKIKKCNKEEWEKMSRNCVEWYNSYISPLSAFKTTQRLLNEKNII